MPIVKPYINPPTYEEAMGTVQTGRLAVEVEMEALREALELARLEIAHLTKICNDLMLKIETLGVTSQR